MNIVEALSVLVMASATSLCLGEQACRSGSIPYCGELDTPGPHCMDCLRSRWEKVGCKPEGTKGPNNEPESVKTWNLMTVEKVIENMEEYPGMADFLPSYCYGSEKNAEESSTNLPHDFPETTTAGSETEAIMTAVVLPTNSNSKICRSGSIRYCGELDTPGPHCMECLRALWKMVGCKPEGEMSPDSSSVQVEFWNKRTVQETKDSMNYYTGIPAACSGTEKQGATDMASQEKLTTDANVKDTSKDYDVMTSAILEKRPDARPISVTSDPPVTSRGSIRISIGLPGGSSGKGTRGVHFNSTATSLRLTKEFTRKTVMYSSLAGALLAIGSLSSFALYGLYKKRKRTEKSGSTPGGDGDAEAPASTPRSQMVSPHVYKYMNGGAHGGDQVFVYPEDPALKGDTTEALLNATREQNNLLRDKL